MIQPLVRIGALRLGCEFETALTKRRGIVLERVAHTPGVEVAWTDGRTFILHNEIKVRPLLLHTFDEDEPVH